MTLFDLNTACVHVLTHMDIKLGQQTEQVCRSSLLSNRNVRWPRRMLHPMSHGKCADGTDRQTDRQTLEHYITLSAKRNQRNKHITHLKHKLLLLIRLD